MGGNGFDDIVALFHFWHSNFYVMISVDTKGICTTVTYCKPAKTRPSSVYVLFMV